MCVDSLIAEMNKTEVRDKKVLKNVLVGVWIFFCLVWFGFVPSPPPHPPLDFACQDLKDVSEILKI